MATNDSIHQEITLLDEVIAFLQAHQGKTQDRDPDWFANAIDAVRNAKGLLAEEQEALEEMAV